MWRARRAPRLCASPTTTPAHGPFSTPAYAVVMSIVASSTFSAMIVVVRLMFTSFGKRFLNDGAYSDVPASNEENMRDISSSVPVVSVL
jgi:hypothetical protein